MVDFEKYMKYGDGASESIFTAALRDDCLFIIKYIKEQNSLSIIDKREQSLLHLAVRSRSMNVVNLLLDFDVDVNAKDRYGDTPLHIATHMGSYEIVKLLVENDADINSVNKMKDTPIHRAALKGSYEVVELLVNEGVVLNVFDEFRVSVLQKAIKSKSKKLVEYLVNQGAIINSVDRGKQTTMHYAAKFGTTQIVSYLFEQGLTGYAKTTYDMTPLHYAVTHPDSEMVRLFIEQGSTSYDKNSFNESPYDLAEANGKYETVELFMQLKNDEEYQAKLKQNELCLAIIKNEFDFASALIERVDINEKDAFGNTALFYAVMNEETFLVRKLLKHGASVIDVNSHGEDAIYFAALLHNDELFDLIMGHTNNLYNQYFGLTVIELLDYTKGFECLELINRV